MEHKIPHTADAKPDKPKKVKVLPQAIITVSDLGRLSRELAAVEDFYLQAKAREAGKQPKLPRVSRGLEELANQYDLNLLHDADRQQLKTMLEGWRQNAPVLHFSFAADPAAVFLTKLITWLRDEIHPNVLLNIGLQPGIAAGCIVRTTNKYFDFSLRKHLDDSSNLLLQALTESDTTGE